MASASTPVKGAYDNNTTGTNITVINEIPRNFDGFTRTECETRWLGVVAATAGQLLKISRESDVKVYRIGIDVGRG